MSKPANCQSTVRRHKAIHIRIGRHLRPITFFLTSTLGGWLYFLLRHLPLWSIRPLAFLLAALSYPLVKPSFSRRARANLDLAFADSLTRAQKRRLLRRAYANAVLCLFESMALSRSWQLVADRHANWPDLQRVLGRLHETGEGVVLITGHVGAWEILGLLVPRVSETLVVAKRTRSEAINRLLTRIRESQGSKVAYYDDSPRSLLETLKRGGTVGILADHAFKGISAMHVPFFGHPTPMPTAPFALARSTGAPLVFMLSIRERSGYRLLLAEPFKVPRTDDRERDVREPLERWAAFLERSIREHPESWLPLAGHWKKLQR